MASVEMDVHTAKHHEDAEEAVVGDEMNEDKKEKCLGSVQCLEVCGMSSAVPSYPMDCRDDEGRLLNFWCPIGARSPPIIRTL